MRAIPTTYKGVQFRSRLEADWAATLDDLGIGWRYEPEGYALSDGTWYSPDFYLPASRVWLEVKGEHMERVSKVEQFAADLWTEFWQANERYQHLITGRTPGAPLVIIAEAPHLRSELWGHETMRYRAVKGVRAYYSAVIDRCPLCLSVSFRDRGSPFCRVCREGEIDREPTHDEFYARPFVRLPRPAGNGRR